MQELVLEENDSMGESTTIANEEEITYDVGNSELRDVQGFIEEDLQDDVNQYE